MWLHACRHNGLAIYRELRTPLIGSERFDEFFHNPLANIRFLELDNERGSNCSVIEQFHNVFSTVGSPCRSNRGFRWMSVNPASLITNSIMPGSDNSNIGGALSRPTFISASVETRSDRMRGVRSSR